MARGARSKKPPAPPCANCATALAGAYCHACGQKAHLHHRLRDLVEELLEGVAHFDGRLWRTLPLLALNPGRLNREWREGKRVRYVAPLHLFLFAVFLLFLIPTVTGERLLDFGEAAQLQREADTSGGVNFSFGNVVEPPADGAAAPEVRPPTEEELAQLPPLVATLVKAVGKLTSEPGYYGYKIETLAYKLSFVVVPISIAILALLMVFKRGYTLYDHAVTSLYGLGFLVLMIIVVNLAPRPLDGWLAWLAFVAAAVHAVVHMRGAYRISWAGAVLRGLGLGLLTSIGFGLFLLMVVALGLAG